MSKRTALQLVNDLLGEIYQTEITDISISTGHAKVALRKLNNAILEIYNKALGRWYTQLKTRQYKASFNSKIIVVDFSSLSGDIITITYNGTAVVLTEGVEFTAVTSNEVTAFAIATAINVHASLDGIVATAQGDIVIARVTPVVNLAGITATSTDSASTVMTAVVEGNGEFTLPDDFVAIFVLKDITNNRIIHSEWDKIIDHDDPDEDTTGTPLIFSIRTDHLRIYPKPDSAILIKEAYWKIATRLAANTDLYTLPEFCEAAILKVAEAEMWYYIDKTTKGDRARGRAKILIEDAVETNDQILSKILKLDASGEGFFGDLAMIPPSLGSNFENPFGF